MRAAVCSLRFAPGHAAHLRAYKELFKALGCDTRLFLDERYKGFFEPEENIFFTTVTDEILEWRPDVLVSYNIANINIGLALKCRKSGVRFYYVLHEPVTGLKRMMSLGKRAPRRLIANAVNYLSSKWAYKVILASENGKNIYLQTMKKCNSNYDVFPLIFCNDYDASLQIQREYFSYIGGFTENRGCGAFLQFAEYALEKDPNIRFMIATRDSLPERFESKKLNNAVLEGRMLVFSGKPMTTLEINRHYRESVCVWNAYKQSTQSGVLPNALMQGAPVLVSRRPDVTEVIVDGREGRYISIPYSNKEIMDAYSFIMEHLEETECNARECFLKQYHYSNFLERARIVFEI